MFKDALTTINFKHQPVALLSASERLITNNGSTDFDSNRNAGLVVIVKRDIV